MSPSEVMKTDLYFWKSFDPAKTQKKFVLFLCKTRQAMDKNIIEKCLLYVIKTNINAFFFLLSSCYIVFNPLRSNLLYVLINTLLHFFLTQQHDWANLELVYVKQYPKLNNATLIGYNIASPKKLLARYVFYCYTPSSINNDKYFYINVSSQHTHLIQRIVIFFNLFVETSGIQY